MVSVFSFKAHKVANPGNQLSRNIHHAQNSAGSYMPSKYCCYHHITTIIIMSHDEATSCELMQISRHFPAFQSDTGLPRSTPMPDVPPPSYTYKMHNYSICVNVYGSYPHNQNLGKTPNDPINF